MILEPGPEAIKLRQGHKQGVSSPGNKTFSLFQVSVILILTIFNENKHTCRLSTIEINERRIFSLQIYRSSVETLRYENKFMLQLY